MPRILPLLILAVLQPLAAFAGDPLVWPRFRGPNGSGVSPDGRPPIDLGPETNVKWKVAAPAGASSPIVAGDLLVFTAEADGKLLTVACRRSDGAEAWRAEAPVKELEKYLANEGSPAASTPATDGQRIVSYFGSCGLFCYDLAGRELWRREMPPAATLGSFGTGVSPIIEQGLVILLRDEALDPQLIALDAATGEVQWQKPRTSTGGWSTPVVLNVDAGKQLVAVGQGRLVAYNLPTGAEMWYVEGMPAATCSSPVVDGARLYFAGWSPGSGDEQLFRMPPFKLVLLGDSNSDGQLSKDEMKLPPLKDYFDSIDGDHDGLITAAEWDHMQQVVASSQNVAFAVDAGGSGDVTATHVRWQAKRGLPYVPSAIFYENQYVMVKDGGIVTAYDGDSGKELYQKRLGAEGNYYASPVAAAGHIYLTSLADGTITVLKAGADPPEVVVQNPPLGERVAATPAIVGDTMYLRTAGHLYAFARGK
ncbi:MAG: PQQ-binding-like beta-propeller repeat protein [Pirellulales bacterium]|nr:PQQ-binding-like beta-propeller repeat protein [Pirellulales bacterium]